VCRAEADSARREWRLERRGRASTPQWVVVFRSATLDRPTVDLPLPNAAPDISPARMTLSYQSANGGRSVEWTAIPGGPSSLDLVVNHGLEVNVERDLDPAVELMNTEGALAVRCELPERPAPAPMGEWMIGTGVAWSVPVFDSQSGRGYVVQTVSWGRELTSGGPGMLRGRFVWAVEVTPVFGQFSPTTVYGLGVSPLFWRWNFDPHGRWAPFAELSVGGLWTSSPVPEFTSSANFTAHAAFGTRIRASARSAFALAFRFQHISNGNVSIRNPGVNAPVAWFGATVR
jgi:hypothetical protein